MLILIYYVHTNLHLTAFRSAKDNLKTVNFVVTLDFSENFAFVVQESVQGFHRNNNQATVHPFVIYHKNNKTNKIEHVSYVGISDCLNHNTNAVHMFTKKLVAFLKQNFTVVERIKHFSDGAHQQNKNKKKIYQFIGSLNKFWSCGRTAFLCNRSWKRSLRRCRRNFKTDS